MILSYLSFRKTMGNLPKSPTAWLTWIVGMCLLIFIFASVVFGLSKKESMFSGFNRALRRTVRRANRAGGRGGRRSSGRSRRRRSSKRRSIRRRRPMRRRRRTRRPRRSIRSLFSRGKKKAARPKPKAQGLSTNIFALARSGKLTFI